MPVYAVENFAYGLDARRSPLSKAPGTLVTLRNGFITNGGEIAKRKAFQRVVLPEGCFGLEVTEKGLTTFGNNLFPGLLDTGGPSGYIESLKPRMVYYQRLLHPAQVLRGATTIAPPLKRIQCSTNAGGKAFVAAVFERVGDATQEDTFTYYDGNLIWDSALGLVFNAGGIDTRNKQATALLAAVEPLEALGWQFESSEPRGIKIFSPSGNAMTGEISVESTNELAQMRLTHGNGVAGVEADGPEFHFTVTAGTYTNVHFQITVTETAAGTFSIYSSLLDARYTLYALRISGGKLLASLRDDNWSYPDCDLDTVINTGVDEYAIALFADANNKLYARRYWWNGANYTVEGTDKAVLFQGTQLSGGALQGTATEVAQDIVDAINIMPHWWQNKTNDNENFTAQLTGTSTVVIKAPPSFAGKIVTYKVSDYTGPLTGAGAITLQTAVAKKNLLVTGVSNDLEVSAATPVALAVTLVPFPVYQSARYNSNAYAAPRIYTPVVKAVVTGGSGNYTYTWSKVQDDDPNNNLGSVPLGTGREDSHQWFGTAYVNQPITETWQLRVVDTTDATKPPVEIRFPVTVELIR